MVQTVNPTLLQLLQNQAQPVTQGPANLVQKMASQGGVGPGAMAASGMGSMQGATGAQDQGSLMQALTGGVQQGVGLAQLLAQMGLGGGRTGQEYMDLAAVTQSPSASLAAAEQGQSMMGGGNQMNLLRLLGLGG